MAKKGGGFFGAMGSLGRLLIWGFAALAVVAIYLGLSGPTAPPSETTAEALEEGATDAGEAAVEETEPEVAEEPASEGEEDPAPEAGESEAAEPDAMEPAEAEAEPTSEGEEDPAPEAADTEAAEPADAMETEAATEETPVEDSAGEAAEADSTLPDSGPADLTDEFEEEDAAEGAVDGGAVAAGAPLAEFPIPGEDAVIRLMSVEPIEDERYEAVLEREAGGEVQSTTVQLTCAPRAVGLVVDDGGTPELEVIVPGTPEADIAEAACAAVE